MLGIGDTGADRGGVREIKGDNGPDGYCLALGLLCIKLNITVSTTDPE